MMFHLPREILEIIYSYDTFKFDKLKKITRQIPKVRDNKIAYLVHHKNFEIIIKTGYLRRLIIVYVISVTTLPFLSGI